MAGWLDHARVQDVLKESHLFTFPSIREFGGGVVLEAMAVALPPLVVDYAGPGELVTDETGFKVPIGTRDEVIAGVRSQVGAILGNPALLTARAGAARTRIQEMFSWQAKAEQIDAIYQRLA